MADKGQVRKGVAGLVLASAALVGFISGWEGTSYPVYRDIVGIPTVCEGHTGPDVRVGDVWSKERCDAILVKNIDRFSDAVLRCVQVPINQNQYEAFVALAFNIGSSAFCSSTLVRVANTGNLSGACEQILRWNRAGGRMVQGLVNRRHAERDLCLRPVQSPQPTKTEVA